ncbi:unnamed protein product, partial [marine sediment metagenome]
MVTVNEYAKPASAENISERNLNFMVFVLAPDKTPLMPCASVIARLLIKDNKAKV